MRILAIDTSSEHWNAAVVDVNGDELHVRGRAEAPVKEPVAIAFEAMDAARVKPDSVDVLALGAPPGGSSSSAEALLALQGLSLAWSRPLVVVSSLEALALAGGEMLVKPGKAQTKGGLGARLVAANTSGDTHLVAAILETERGVVVGQFSVDGKGGIKPLRVGKRVDDGAAAASLVRGAALSVGDAPKGLPKSSVKHARLFARALDVARLAAMKTPSTWSDAALVALRLPDAA